MALIYGTPLATAFSSLIADFNSDQRFILCIVAMGCIAVLTLVLSIVAMAFTASVREHAAETELKRDLLDQGRSAEEIERILRPADGCSRAMANWFGGGRKDR